MYHDYRSKSFSQLTHQFLNLISENFPHDPFKKNWIIVQNREMEQWLTLNLAKRQKIAANNEFIFPSEFIWKLYRIKDSELSMHLPSDAIPLQWSIYEVLESEEPFQQILFGNREVNSKALFQLSKSIADVFDLYQFFRPEMLEKWESGHSIFQDSQEQWQAKLWKSLSKKWQQRDEITTRVQALNKLSTSLKQSEYPFQEIPENIWMFAVPHVSKPFSEILALLSNHVDCFHFSFDLDADTDIDHTDVALFSQKLLKAANQNKLVLERSLQAHKVKINSVLSSEIFKTDKSKLKQIQKMLWNESISPQNIDHSSLSIHSCHSRKREVEVVKDSILEVLNNDENVQAEDILLLVPKISDYRSQLYDVFASDNNKPTLPINLGFLDNTEFKESSFLNVLSILNSDFKVNSVIDLLDNSIISTKWKFTNADIQLIREWVKELHIHRFLDGDIFSWANGLNRLFLGFAMEPEDYKLVQQTVPFEKLYSKEAVELVGKLSSFVNQLSSHSTLTSSTLPLADWLSNAKGLVNSFLLPNYDEEFGIQSLLKKLDTLKKQVSVSEFSGVINFETFFLWLKDQFSSTNSSSTGFGRGITVSEYIPNRAIPYKFVAILGFNESVFPRTNIRPDFDLINKYPQPGDRISKDEDQLLFFDMVQSAQDLLHISFLGQDQYTQNKKAPSILLQQLIDAAQSEGITLEITEHKLHGFDPVYFKEDELQSFSHRRLELAQNIVSPAKNTKSFLDQNASKLMEIDLSEISIPDLISFYSHSSRFACNNVFGIRDNENFQDIEDREPFYLGGLEAYFLKDYLKEAYLGGKELNEISELTKAKGLLPEGYPGLLELEHNKQLIEQFEEVRSSYDFTQSESIEIDYEDNDISYSGTVSSVLDKERVVIRLGEIKAKNRMDLWINHLALNTKGNFLSTIFYIKDKKSVEKLSLTPDMVELKHLSFLTDYFKNQVSLAEPNFYPTETSYAFAQSILSGEEMAVAIQKSLKKWDGGNYASSECDDFYNQLILESDSFIYSESFQRAALKIWSPIIKAFGGL